MLPSRLFRNTGLPPALRSLIIPRASLPPTIAVQLRFRLGVLPGTLNSAYSTAQAPAPPPPSSSSSPPPPLQSVDAPPTAKTGSTTENAGTPATTNSHTLPEKLEPRLSMTFTCTAPGCSERSTHEFTKRSYTRGIVLVQCPGCKNRHLIADHLGWFKDSTKEGKLRTVEDILRDRGETVRRGTIDADGVIEYAE
ncbi:hypothetical protein D9615_003838 [Tricholomella constricta]|uniref:DNL-type domain-containing protein n=1 Tax=Tricholomella constricta TaxID=117010 RepID=A0A8H5M7S9_9AGAR|nr:hypothetical protein D9615_003838 [Tricholomella constricta]